LKYLFAHHRLQEQIGLETKTIYSHLPTQENHNHDRLLEDVLADETEISIPRETMNDVNDDPFFVDEKQPIFNGNRSMNTGIL
jgi:hypothetical protein